MRKVGLNTLVIWKNQDIFFDEDYLHKIFDMKKYSWIDLAMSFEHEINPLWMEVDNFFGRGSFHWEKVWSQNICQAIV